MNNRLNNSIRNAFTGLIKYTISILVPFFIRTIMIYKIGDEYSGITSLFSSILQVLSLSELGFSSAVVYALYKPVANKDEAKICALLGLFKRIYRICGLTILTLGLLVCPFIKNMISGTFPSDINIYIIYILLLLSTVVSYMFCAYKSALFIANQRTDIESKTQIYSNSILYTLQIIAILATKNYYLYVVSILIGNLLNNLFLHIFSRKMFPSIRCKGKVEYGEKKQLYSNVIALFGHQLDMIVINSADNIVISTFLGLGMITMYNNYYFIVSAVLSILIMIANSFVASIGNSIVVSTREENHKKFITFTYSIGIINVICTILMLVLFQDFMTLWMGKERLFNLGTVILLVSGFYVRQMRRSVLTYKNAAGVWKLDMLKPYVAATINLILNIIFVKTIGINGVIISTVVSMLLIELPWEIYALFKGYFKTGVGQYIRIQFQLILKLCLICLAVYYSMEFIQVNNVFLFIIKGLCASILIIVFITMFSYKDNEFKTFIGLIKYVLQRKEA